MSRIRSASVCPSPLDACCRSQRVGGWIIFRAIRCANCWNGLFLLGIVHRQPPCHAGGFPGGNLFSPGPQIGDGGPGLPAAEVFGEAADFLPDDLFHQWNRRLALGHIFVHNALQGIDVEQLNTGESPYPHFDIPRDGDIDTDQRSGAASFQGLGDFVHVHDRMGGRR